MYLSSSGISQATAGESDFSSIRIRTDDLLSPLSTFDKNHLMGITQQKSVLGPDRYLREMSLLWVDGSIHSRGPVSSETVSSIYRRLLNSRRCRAMSRWLRDEDFVEDGRLIDSRYLNDSPSASTEWPEERLVCRQRAVHDLAKWEHYFHWFHCIRVFSLRWTCTSAVKWNKRINYSYYQSPSGAPPLRISQLAQYSFTVSRHSIPCITDPPKAPQVTLWPRCFKLFSMS